MPKKATEDFLAHYGVEGMRWGIRKEDRRTSHINVTDSVTGVKSMINYDPKKVAVSRNKDGSISIKGTDKREIANVKRQLTAAKAHPDHKIARETLKKSLATVSNKDLQATNQRLNLEKQYTQLKFERSTVGKGKNHVGTILGVVGTAGAILTTYAKLSDPKSQKAIKSGAAWISNTTRVLPGIKSPNNARAILKNPVIAKRVLNVAKLAAKAAK